MAGKMIARQLEASAPMSAMNRSRRGMSAAATTGVRAVMPSVRLCVFDGLS